MLLQVRVAKWFFAIFHIASHETMLLHLKVMDNMFEKRIVPSVANAR